MIIGVICLIGVAYCCYNLGWVNGAYAVYKKLGMTTEEPGGYDEEDKKEG